MRIAIINNLFGATARGGAEHLVQLEAEALTAAGHEVLVVSLGAGAARGGVCRPGVACEPPLPFQHEELAVPNLFPYVELARHGLVARLAWHAVDAVNFGAARRLERRLDEFRPEVVHTHNLMGFGFLVPRMLRRRGWRHVHTVHDVQLVDPSGLISVFAAHFCRRFARKVHARKLAWLFGSPAAVIFPSAFMRDFHGQYGFFPKSQRVVVENPAPLPAVGERNRPERLRFLFVGQLEEHKGLRLLLQTWAAAKLAGATLEIVGTGALGKEVETADRADASIIYRGRLGGAALSAAYAQASFVVVPSLVIENSPTVILEAFAAGTPVIAFAQGGIPELVRDGETGFLLPLTARGLQDSLLDALRRAAALDGAVWEGMGKRAREAVARRTMENYLGRLLSLFRPRGENA